MCFAFQWSFPQPLENKRLEIKAGDISEVCFLCVLGIQTGNNGLSAQRAIREVVGEESTQAAMQSNAVASATQMSLGAPSPMPAWFFLDVFYHCFPLSDNPADPVTGTQQMILLSVDISDPLGTLNMKS